MAGSAMDRYLEQYPPPSGFDREATTAGGPHRPAARRLPIERTIDLHGLTVAEAEVQLRAFIAEARREDVTKILVIHGKGASEGSRGVLKSLVQRELEQSPYIGTTGTPSAADGGSGATWAIVRQRSR